MMSDLEKEKRLFPHYEEIRQEQEERAQIYLLRKFKKAISKATKFNEPIEVGLGDCPFDFHTINKAQKELYEFLSTKGFSLVSELTWSEGTDEFQTMITGGVLKIYKEHTWPRLPPSWPRGRQS